MSTTQIPQPKLFHHNNLQLSIVYDSHFDIYTIEIHRLNDNTTFNPFGIFLTLQHAISKFNTIKL
jgi:hypothetical protein